MTATWAKCPMRPQHVRRQHGQGLRRSRVSGTFRYPTLNYHHGFWPTRLQNRLKGGEFDGFFADDRKISFKDRCWKSNLARANHVIRALFMAHHSICQDGKDTNTQFLRSDFPLYPARRHSRRKRSSFTQCCLPSTLQERSCPSSAPARESYNINLPYVRFLCPLPLPHSFRHPHSSEARLSRPAQNQCRNP